MLQDSRLLCAQNCMRGPDTEEFDYMEDKRVITFPLYLFALHSFPICVHSKLIFICKYGHTHLWPSNETILVFTFNGRPGKSTRQNETLDMNGYGCVYGQCKTGFSLVYCCLNCHV